jgi:hypothetical protein
MDQQKPSMRMPVRPLVSDGRAIDVRDAVVAAVAREITRHFGGNPVLNVLEAEAHVERLLGISSQTTRVLNSSEVGHADEE